MRLMIEMIAQRWHVHHMILEHMEFVGHLNFGRVRGRLGKVHQLGIMLDLVHRLQFDCG